MPTRHRLQIRGLNLAHSPWSHTWWRCYGMRLTCPVAAFTPHTHSTHTPIKPSSFVGFATVSLFLFACNGFLALCALILQREGQPKNRTEHEPNRSCLLAASALDMAPSWRAFPLQEKRKQLIQIRGLVGRTCARSRTHKGWPCSVAHHVWDRPRRLPRAPKTATSPS